MTLNCTQYKEGTKFPSHANLVPQCHYYIHFWTNTLGKGVNPLINQLWIKSNQFFFYKNGFGIKEPTKVDMPLNKETKLNQMMFIGFIFFTSNIEKIQHILYEVGGAYSIMVIVVVDGHGDMSSNPERCRLYFT